MMQRAVNQVCCHFSNSVADEDYEAGSESSVAEEYNEEYSGSGSDEEGSDASQASNQENADEGSASEEEEAS